jgi:hypothetical protein
MLDWLDFMGVFPVNLLRSDAGKSARAARKALIAGRLRVFSG